MPSNQRFWSYINGVSEERLTLAEGRSCATALKRVDEQQVLTINGSSQNNYPFDDFHVLIGLTPSVIHPNPERALAVGLGIGATPYGMASDPRFDELTTVELCGGEIDLLESLAEDGAPGDDGGHTRICTRPAESDDPDAAPLFAQARHEGATQERNGMSRVGGGREIQFWLLRHGA